MMKIKYGIIAKRARVLEKKLNTLLTVNLMELKASVTLALASLLRKKAQVAFRSWDQFDKTLTISCF